MLYHCPLYCARLQIRFKKIVCFEVLRSASIEFYLRVSDEEIFLKKMSSPSVPYVVIFYTNWQDNSLLFDH